MIEQQYTPSHLLRADHTSQGLDNDIACPSCGRSDATSKASSIARSGRGRLVLEDGSLAIFESELAGLLSEPERPRNLPFSMIVNAVAVGAFLLLADIAIIAGLRAQDYVPIPEDALDTALWLGVAWFGLLIPGIATMRYLARREGVTRQLPQWHIAHARWRELRYCARDDVVYVPNEDRVYAPEYTALLYRPIHTATDSPATQTQKAKPERPAQRERKDAAGAAASANSNGHSRPAGDHTPSENSLVARNAARARVNGYAPNGYSSYGNGLNGYSSNGHDSNGHNSNGHNANGSNGRTQDRPGAEEESK